MKPSTFSLRDGVTVATIGVVTVVGFSLLFWTLSQPRRADARLTAVQSRLDQATRLASSQGDTHRYPPNAICKDADSGAAAAKALLDNAAGKAGIALEQAQITRAGTDPEPMLASLSVEVSAKGQEAGLKTFLQNLTDQAPAVFTDAIDLSSDGVSVSLRMKGRLLCHDHRLP